MFGLHVVVCALFFSPTVGQSITNNDGDIIFKLKDGNKVGFKVGEDADFVDLTDLPNTIDTTSENILRGMFLGYTLGHTQTAISNTDGDIIFKYKNGHKIGFKVGEDADFIDLTDLPIAMDTSSENSLRGIFLGYTLGQEKSNAENERNDLLLHLKNDTDKKIEDLFKDSNEASTKIAKLATEGVSTRAKINFTAIKLVSTTTKLDKVAHGANVTQTLVGKITECNSVGLIYDTESQACMSTSLAATINKVKCSKGNLGVIRANSTTGGLESCVYKNKTYEFNALGASVSDCDLIGSPITTSTGPLGSCKAYRDASPKGNPSCAPSGKYKVKHENGDVSTVYCEMTLANGGWQLVLSLTHGNNQYGGTTSPFIHDLNANNPTLTGKYSRDWRKRIDPAKGHEWLLRRQNKDWVRFEQTYDWCGWNNRGSCHGVSSHLQFTRGKLFDMNGKGPLREKNGRNRLMERFNGCAYDGNCGSGNGDGVGFGSGPSWSHGAGNYGDVYGAGYNNRGAGGSSMYWGSNSEQQNSLPYNYFWRPGK